MSEIQKHSPEIFSPHLGQKIVLPELGQTVEKELIKALEASKQETEDMAIFAIEQMRLASIDKMTGLPNRNAWIDKIQHFNYDRGDNASLIVCDINGLKKTNDEKGHSVGDILKKKTANLLKKTFNRAHDYVFITGGDEFVILIKDTKTPQDQKSLEKYVEEKLSPENQKSAGANVSYGIAHFDPSQDKSIDVVDRIEGRNYQTTFDRADASMYHQKRAGGSARE